MLSINVTCTFQFYIVRLKASGGSASIGDVKFQFYIVRLKANRILTDDEENEVSILYSSIKREVASTVLILVKSFQFYIVRLKESCVRCSCKPCNVSILYSSIKSGGILACLPFRRSFNSI